jgi:hypothetical protein
MAIQPWLVLQGQILDGEVETWLKQWLKYSSRPY